MNRYDPEIAAEDEENRAISAHIHEIATETLKNFKYDRIKEYYAGSTDVFIYSMRANHALQEARDLLKQSPRAAFIFAVIATEIIWKRLILEPMIRGLVVDDTAASLVASSLIGDRGFSNFKQLLIQILNSEMQLDFNTWARPGCKKPLMQELEEAFKKRNRIAHYGDLAGRLEAKTAIDIAEYMFGEIFLKFLDRFDLNIFKDRLSASSNSTDSADSATSTE